MDQSLIQLLTANVKTASDEVTRTYNAYVAKKKAYDEILAYEAELDRQRLEKISQNDALNADKLSSLLRNEVRPTRERIGQELAAALNDYNNAKSVLDSEKSKLSQAEKDYYNAIASSEASKAQAEASKATTEATKAALEAETTAVAQKNSRTILVVGLVLVVVAVSAFIYFKYIKK